MSVSGTEALTNCTKKTGEIWWRSHRERARVIDYVCRRLENQYGRPRHGNPEDPLDDLIFVILSNKTSPDVGARIYASLKQRFTSWDQVLRSSRVSLTSLLRPGGLGLIKSKQIRGLLTKVREEFGQVDLTPLRSMASSDVEEYLVSLPGVSLKVAKCVMMYTLGAEVLPVDTHVHRIATRLGWINRKRADQCHEELEALVPPKRRLAFHVACISHGRAMCRPREPLCEVCPINRHCLFHERANK